MTNVYTLPAAEHPKAVEAKTRAAIREVEEAAHAHAAVAGRDAHVHAVRGGEAFECHDAALVRIGLVAGMADGRGHFEYVAAINAVAERVVAHRVKVQLVAGDRLLDLQVLDLTNRSADLGFDSLGMFSNRQGVDVGHNSSGS